MIIPRKGKRLLHNVHVPHLFPDNPHDVLFHSKFTFILDDYSEPMWRCAHDVCMIFGFFSPSSPCQHHLAQLICFRGTPLSPSLSTPHSHAPN